MGLSTFAGYSRGNMGLSIGSRSSYDRYTVPVRNTYTEPVLPNPNPTNYKIIRCIERSTGLLLELKYPDCTNYEGRKILLYARGTKLLDIVNQGSIDPHFSNSKKFKSPIARFEPTTAGWQMGLKML